jgi:hypothetical protein
MPSSDNMVDYDPEVLQKYADRLYRRAIMAIITYSFMGLFFGVIGGVLIQAPIDEFEADYETEQNLIVDNMCFIFTGLGLLIGIEVGFEKTLELRAQAQIILWHKQTGPHFNPSQLR